MIVVFAFLLGAAFGWYRAGKLQGNRADKFQYAFGFGLAFSVVGLILAVYLTRTM